MQTVELLAPAGGWDCLKTGIESGADAVYFGVEKFSARARASNFKLSELKTVVDKCHEQGVRSYLALNTLIKNSELDSFFKIAETAYSEGIDAFIIQDLSLANKLRESFGKDVEIHASTQASINNKYFKPLLVNVDRVVLPREMSLGQIQEFIDYTNLDVEVFVQGALCFSISGQCLMSSFLGGRSANRGICAQPCRKKYNSRYHMSTKDLCLIESMDKIVPSGIKSIKIEGRLRSPEYVGAAVSLYRIYLDEGCVNQKAYEDLQIAFSREYTSGGLMKDMDVVTPLKASKRGIFVGTVEEDSKICLKNDVYIGDGVQIKTGNGTHGDIIRNIKFENKEVEKGLTGKFVEIKFNAKKGDKIYLTSGRQRRKNTKLPKREPIQVNRKQSKKIKIIKNNQIQGEDPSIHVKTNSFEDALIALKTGADYAYYNIFEHDADWGKVSPYVPSCLNTWSAKNAIDKINGNDFNSMLCGDLGVALNTSVKKTLLDISCNAFNDVSVTQYQNLGLKPTISPELSFNEIMEFSDKRFVLFAFGRLPLMKTAYELDQEKLIDEKGFEFPIKKELDKKIIYNSIPHSISKRVPDLLKQTINEFLIYEPEDVKGTVQEYVKLINKEKTTHKKGYTLGNYQKGIK